MPWADNVARMRKWLEKHPEATWHKAADRSPDAEHLVTWPKADASPAHDGEIEEAKHQDLGCLVDYLEALDRSTMGSSPAR